MNNLLDFLDDLEYTEIGLITMGIILLMIGVLNG
jgi:hypothetical protein